MNKPIKYLIIAFIAIVCVYNSIYFEELDTIKKAQTDAAFDAKNYASAFFKSDIETLSSTDAAAFLQNINTDLKGYSEANGNKLGISNDYYFIIDGNAIVRSIEEEYVVVELSKDQQKLKIATDFIFGNAIREGTQMANIGDYQNTMDYNSISVELNAIVRETVVPPFIQKVQELDDIYFKGAVKVNTKKQKIENLRVIPMILKINK